MTTPVLLRPYEPTDLSQVTGMFRNAIDTLAAEDYTIEQRAAWASAADNEPAFAKRLRGQTVLVAGTCCALSGFASLDHEDNIDMLYVDPGAARQGVATQLVETLEGIARARGASGIEVHASDVARPLFAGRGYVFEETKIVERNGVRLPHHQMRKTFGETPSSGEEA